MVEAQVKMFVLARVLLDGLGARLAAARRDERGQTAAEYLGIVVVVAVLITALVTTDIGSKIGTGVTNMIDKITSKGPQ